MSIERKVLALVRTKCSFTTPEVLHVAADGSFDIRTRLEGIVDPSRAYDCLGRDAQLAVRLGGWAGAALAQLHAAVQPDVVPDWLPRKVSWPESGDWIRERLPSVIGNDSLAAEISAVLAIYENLTVANDDRVLAHTDLGLHNIVFSDDFREPCGLIDFEAAAYVDRHFDFRYLILDTADTTLLTSACETYEAISGKRLLPARIQLYNAASACSYLAYRAGIAPEVRWCGRTLAEDINWTTLALQRFRAHSPTQR
ncbi:MAG: aminoglycoside phosphotransferase family protein [Pseudomonadota bacterium]